MINLDKKILKKIKNKHVDRHLDDEHRKVVVAVPSPTLMFLTPILVAIFLGIFFNFSRRVFIGCIIGGVICGCYNVYRIISNLMNDDK